MGHDGKSTLVFNGAAIRDRAEMLSVTDMWKAGGSIDAKRPTDWLALASTKEFVACVDASFRPYVASAPTQSWRSPANPEKMARSHDLYPVGR